MAELAKFPYFGGLTDGYRSLPFLQQACTALRS
jgi:hypothetical protein